MANNTETEIPINYKYCYSAYKLHVKNVNLSKKSLCDRNSSTHQFPLNIIIKYHTYNEICKNCLRSLPTDILEQVRYNFIVAKLKG